MNKAAKLSAQLEKMTPEAAIDWMEEASARAIHSRVLGDTMWSWKIIDRSAKFSEAPAATINESLGLILSPKSRTRN